ncbi:hypothetical protein K491DRAFT_714863 [Lophiostoma macrostomum CBS 122681]|uniref:Uncharacterized protein n=1 Tax=Lophiostoma macrostomum CBS 122681 TaxID=1314788 RepID=A0A6A6TAG2_9PLEO|nr:hypothetical protein K491DRAFT_714863 [Lophiostoma macrostomum CBS 122681]
MSRDRLMNLLARNPVDEPKKNSQVDAKPRRQSHAIQMHKIQNDSVSDNELKQFGDKWIEELWEEKPELRKKVKSITEFGMRVKVGEEWMPHIASKSSEKKPSGGAEPKADTRTSNHTLQLSAAMAATSSW